MSKKPLIIIISTALGILLIGLMGYYFLIQGGGVGGEKDPTGKNFFPLGGDGGPTTPGGEPTTPGGGPAKPTNFTQKLRQLSAEPVAGAGVLDVKAGTPVRYIEKATGHIFEVELFSPNRSRVSNTTIPVVYDAVWGNKNGALVARYLKEDNQTIDTYSLIIKATSTTTDNVISGIAFPSGISDLSVLGDSIFYLVRGENGSTGYTSNFSQGNRKQVWLSPINELLSQYVNQRTVALTTKPASGVPGFMYFVDTGNGNVKKVLGNVPGLSALSNDLGTQLVVLKQSTNALMSLYDIKSNTYSALTPATFPEKCVWSKKDRDVVYCAVPRSSIGGGSLTAWYQGYASFTDDIWQYNLKNNIAVVIENLSENAGQSIDVEKPLLSENEQYLIFMNKIDNTLWSLDLTK